MRRAANVAVLAVFLTACADSPSAPIEQATAPQPSLSIDAVTTSSACWTKYVGEEWIWGAGAPNYSSATPFIASLISVDPGGIGRFRANNPGSTTLYATGPGGSVTCDVIVLGAVTVSISGNTQPPVAGSYVYTATASGGDTLNYQFAWERSDNGGSTWYVPLNSTQNTYKSSTLTTGFGNSATPVLLRVTATSQGRSAVTTLAVNTGNTFDARIDGNNKVTSQGGHTMTAVGLGGDGTYTYEWSEPRYSTSNRLNLYYDACDSGQMVSYVVTVRSAGYAITRDRDVLNFIDPRLCGP